MEGSRRARDGPEVEETEDRRRSMGVEAGAELCVRERGRESPTGDEENWVEVEGGERKRIGAFPDGLVRICTVWFAAAAGPVPPAVVPQGSAALEESEFFVAGAPVDSSAPFKGWAL